MEITKELKKKYPNLLDLDLVYCDNGWYQLIDKTLQKIEDYNKINNKQIKVKVIKKKFGALRIYTDTDDIDVCRTIIYPAIDESCYTCEICSKQGKIKCINGTYLKCLCPECNKKLKNGNI